MSAPQNETNAPVDRRLTTASGGGGGLEAGGGILRFRLWYMERFAEKWLPGFRATKRDQSKNSETVVSDYRSRYIHGSSSPTGTIQSVPARA